MQFFNKTNRIQNNFKELKYRKSKTNTVEKYNFSRDSFFKNKNKTTSNFNLYKNSLISNSSSKDISNKNEELNKQDINYISNKKAELINSSQFDTNFFRNISSKNIKNKINSSKSCDNKNKTNIINWFNKTQIKKKKNDFIKYKFLLGQKNYYKNLFHQDDLSFSSFYSKKINPSINKNPKIFYIDKDKLKKLFLGKNERNIHSIKDFGDNLSISLSKNRNNSQNRKNNFKVNNCTSIKIKKYNSPNILKFQNESLFEDKNIIRSKNNKIIEKSKKNKKIKSKQVRSIHEENNSSKEHDRIIDDNYKEYLKDITSANSNKSKSERKNVNRKNPILIIKNLKPIKKELSLNDKSEISQYKKRLNKYNYSNVMIKNNKKLFEFKKFVSNRKNSLDDISRSISKSMVKEILFLEKKL